LRQNWSIVQRSPISSYQTFRHLPVRETQAQRPQLLVLSFSSIVSVPDPQTPWITLVVHDFHSEGLDVLYNSSLAGLPFPSSYQAPILLGRTEAIGVGIVTTGGYILAVDLNCHEPDSFASLKSRRSPVLSLVINPLTHLA
jgi:hypothetical protein